jgi:hypothetical protein
MLIRGLLGGPTNTNGAVEHAPGATPNPIFRVCIIGISPQGAAGVPQFNQGQCDNSNAGSGSSASRGAGGFTQGEGAMLAAFLGT